MATARQRKKSAKENDASQQNGSVSVPERRNSNESESLGYFERRRRDEYLKEYKENQEELEELYEKDRLMLEGEAVPEEDDRDTDKAVNRFIFWMTVTLVFSNSIASYLSGSLSIMRSVILFLGILVDATMDIVNNTIMGLCLHHARAEDPRYPRGRERLEMIGVLLCSVIMGLQNMAMIAQSINSIIEDTVDPHMTLITMMILVSGCSVKFGIMLFCYRRGNSASKMLSKDMRNDIVTGVVAIICAYVGDAYWKYTDALGAICVNTFYSSYIAYSWTCNVLEHIPLLVGVTAEREQMSRILKITLEHDPRILKIDHVKIYHIGAKALVELHIVMDESLPLKITHDIAHPLEKKLNRVDFVERSFVHCDYTCDGD